MASRSASRGRQLVGILGCTVGIGAFTSAASAQQARLDSVADRELQQLNETGIKFGSFDLRPAFGVAVQASDNIFYTQQNRKADVAAEFRADVSLQSRFSRHELSARAYVEQVTYAKFSAENATQYGAGAAGRLDVSRTTAVDLRANFDHLQESRYSLNSNRSADGRGAYRALRGQAGVTYKADNFSAALTGRISGYKYESVNIAGVPTSQSIRNFTVYEGSADVVYGLRDPMRFVVHAALERRRYALGFGDPGFDPVSFVDRSANGGRIEFGVQREITQLIQGTVRVGYLKYTYTDPRIRDFSALSYHADLVWNVTPLTSIVAAADRKLDETVSPTASGNLRDEAAIGVHHELRRNVILYGDVRYARVKLVGTATRSAEFDVGAGARYYVGGKFVLGAEVRHAQRHSGISGIDFDANIASVSVKLLL